MSEQEKINKMAADICLVKHNCNDVCNPINTCNALKYARRAYEAGYRQQAWISVEERLPEECTHVIVHDEDGTVGEAFHSISDHFEWVANEKIAFVTHWMPLPEPPKGE